MFLSLYLSYVISVCLCFTGIPFVTVYKGPRIELERPQNESVSSCSVWLATSLISYSQIHLRMIDCVCSFPVFLRGSVYVGVIYMQSQTSDCFCLNHQRAGQIPLSVGWEDILTFGTRNCTLVLTEAHTQIFSSPLHCQKKSEKFVPLGVQQQLTGEVPLRDNFVPYVTLRSAY